MTSNEWYGQASSGATSITGAAGEPPEFVPRLALLLEWGHDQLRSCAAALYVRSRPVGTDDRSPNSVVARSWDDAVRRVFCYW